MDGSPIKESDIASFAGLALVVPMLVGALKKFFTKWIDGREPMICMALTVVIGTVAKLTIKGAFAGVGWLTFALSLVLVAGAAAQVHDFTINKVIKGQDGPGTPPSRSGGGGDEPTGGAKP